MKKLSILFAALFCFAFSVKADTFSDGVTVVVGTVSMSDALTSVTAANTGTAMSAGTISYDATSHTLTLDNVEISGSHAQRQLFIHAGLSDFDITLKLIGANSISAVARGIWTQHVKSGKKIIIEGDKDASLNVETSSTTLPALCMALSNGSTATDDVRYHNLDIKGGCSISLKSAWDGALECYHFVLDSCNLVAESVNGVLVVKGGAEFKNVEKMESTISKVDYRVPSEFYPVTINGHQLTNLVPNTNYSYFSGFVTAGEASYDPATRTLTLDNMDIDTYEDPVIKIEDKSGSTEPVRILLKGSSSVYYSGSDGAALLVKTPVIFDGNGSVSNEVQFSTASDGDGIRIEGGSLTLEKLADVMANGDTYGVHGIEVAGQYPTVTLKASNLYAFGQNTASFAGVNLSIPNNDVELTDPSGAEFVAANHQVEVSGSVVKNDQVTFKKNVNVVNIGIAEGQGTVTMLIGEEVQTPPITLNASTDVIFKAEPAEGYVFSKWINSWDAYVSDQATYTATVSSSDLELRAVFYKKLPSDQQLVVVTQNGTISKLDGNINDYTELGSISGTNKVTNATVIMSLLTSQGFVYSDETSSTEVALSLVAYDTGTSAIGTPVALRYAQSTYYPVSAMTFSVHDQLVYMVAYKGASSKWVLLKNDLTGDAADPLGEEVCTLNSTLVPTAYPVTAMAADPEGNLYAIAKGASDGHAWLYKIDKTSGNLTPIADTKYDYNSLYDLQAMHSDIMTDKLIWSRRKASLKTEFIEIDLPQVGQPAALYKLGELPAECSSLSQWVPNAFYDVTVGVKAGHEEGGTATLASGGKTGTFYTGRKVAVVATPAEGHTFAKWSNNSTKAQDTVMVEDADISLEAEFGWASGVTPYPIWIGGKQMHSQRLVMTSENNPAISNTNSSVRYNPDTKVLTFTAPIIYYDGGAIVIGTEEEGLDLTINVRNASTISEYTENGIKIIKSKVTIKGVDKISVGAGKSAVLLDRSELTLEGLEHISWFNGTGAGIKGVTGDEKLTILGCNMKITSTNVSVDNLAECTWNYCTIDPSTAVFEEKKMKDAAGGATSTSLEFTPWPKLTVEPVVDGTGSFTLKSSDSEFTNTGWFQAGVEVTITPNPADGYAFGYWVDDPKWNDEDESQRIAEERKITKSAGSEGKNARFFYVPKSSATWYGVNNNKFVSFSLSDHGLVVAKASSPSASSVKAGDYTTSGWVYQDGSTVKLKDFSGIEDGEEMAGDVTDLGTSATSAKDIAFNFTDKKTYAVDGTKLYSVDEEGKFEEIGAFEFEDAPATNIVSIAINGKGDMFVLQAGVDGRLFSIDEIDEEGKKVKLAKVGDSGFTGISVTNEAQSLAFDHITGELFLGADDAIHIISTEDASAHIVAALGWDKTQEKVIKAMHRKTQLITVRAIVPEACEGWGTATANNKSSVSVLENTKVTLKATPKEGYIFKGWTQGSEDGEEVSKDATYEVVAKGSANKNKYYAHFKKQEEAVDNVNAEYAPAQKVVINGNLYILRDGKMYNVTGALVK